MYEVCPDYPGNPVRLHWGLPDPSAVDASDAARQRAFQQVAHLLVEHTRTLLALIEQRQRSQQPPADAPETREQKHRKREEMR